MGRTTLALMLTGALAFWSVGCETDRPGEEPGSPPQEREPGSPEPGSPEPGSPDDDHDEPGSP